MVKRKNTRSDIEVEIVESGELQQDEIEVIARLLFSWWKRDLERQDEVNRDIRTPEDKSQKS